MHLRLIEIENFRGIKSLSLKLDVITSVFGEGSFGKSSLIEALKVCLSESQPLTKQDFHVPPGKDEVQTEYLSITLTFREGAPGQWKMGYGKLTPVIHDWRDGRREIILKVEGRLNNDSVESTTSFLDAKQNRIDLEDAKAILETLRQISPLIVIPLPDTKNDSGNQTALTSGNAEVSSGARYILSVYKKAVSQPDRLSRNELASAIEALAGLNVHQDIDAGRIARYRVLIDEIAELSNRFAPNAERRVQLLRFGDLHQVVALLTIVGTLLETRGSLEIPEFAEPIIAIENLENNLHPIALASLWDLLAQMPLQKLVTTNSDDLLASVPLRSLRRIQRNRNGLEVFSVSPNSLSTDDVRRIGYHLRLNRADAIMNRCWLFVEGESEGWLLPEMAHILGYDFKSEGVRCVEFAQCGIEPLIKLAQQLGIQWHLLADGDQAGRSYEGMARRFLRGEPLSERISCMKEFDIEHHLCRHGFLDVYAQASNPKARSRRGDSLHAAVLAAVKRNSKPALIMKVIERAHERGVSSVSPLLAHVVETAIRLARSVEPEFAVFSRSTLPN